MLASFDVFDGVISWSHSEDGGNACIWVKHDGLHAWWLWLVYKLTCLILVPSRSLRSMRGWCALLGLMLLVILISFGDSIIFWVWVDSS